MKNNRTTKLKKDINFVIMGSSKKLSLSRIKNYFKKFNKSFNYDELRTIESFYLNDANKKLKIRINDNSISMLEKFCKKNNLTYKIEKVIVDSEEYGQVVIKTNDVDVMKEDLELERFTEKCVVSISSKDIKIIYSGYCDNGEEELTKMGLCRVISCDADRKQKEKIKEELIYALYKQAKSEGFVI